MKQLKILGKNKTYKKRYKAVCKTLKVLSENPKHPGLNTHQYITTQGPKGEKVFEAYAENKTSAAYRVFWYYGPLKKQITIIAITPHP